MESASELAFTKAKSMIERKKKVLLTNHVNTALSVIHETKFSTVLDYLKDKTVLPSDLNDFTAKEDNDKMIDVYYAKAGTKIGMHCHKYNESYICLFGHIVLEVDNQQHTLKSFETMTIKSGLAHSAEIINDSFIVIFKN